MAKRKQPDVLEHTAKDGGKSQSESESSSDDDEEMLDVDFEFFPPRPEIDFHGLKTLLRQLLDVDAQLFDLSALSDLILSQPWLGSTIKSDGEETDPWAFLTVLDLKEHKVMDQPVIRSLVEYLAQQASKSVALAPIAQMLNAVEVGHIGLVLTERLVNVPPQLAPPLYKLLQNEILEANNEEEPYAFTHFLILSKTYQEVESLLDQEDSRPLKKKKNAQTAEVFYFHPEDEICHRHAVAHGHFAYNNKENAGQADSKRAFQELGIEPQGHMILIDASKFAGLVHELEEFVSP